MNRNWVIISCIFMYMGALIVLGSILYDYFVLNQLNLGFIGLAIIPAAGATMVLKYSNFSKENQS